jgi:hypothetical protein
MRKRSEPHTFEQRLMEQKLRLEAEAARLPPGDARDVIAKRIERLQLAADMNRWLSPGEGGSGVVLRSRAVLQPGP